MVDSTYRHCFETASAAAGRQLTEDELDRLFSQLQGRMNRYVGEGLSPREAAMRAGTELGAMHRAAALIERRNALLNLQKRVARRAMMSDSAEGALKRKNGPGLDRAIREQVEASTRGSANSAETFMLGRRSQYLNGLTHDLKAANLLAAARSGALDAEAAREMHAISRGAAPSNNPAGRLAGVLTKYLGQMRERLNAEGAWIGHYDGYINKTTHDPLRIYWAGRGGWAREIMPLLDQARTFENAENPAEFLDNVWQALVTGVHMSDAGGIGFKDPAFSGPGNMAARLSESRVLHFKDADSWLAYQKKYGQPGTLVQHTIHALERGAQQEALLNRWGTNPRVEFDADIRWLKEKYRSASPEAVNKLSDAEESLHDVFDQLDGTANRPANVLWATLARGARLVASTAKLGAVLLTHLSSAATKAALLLHNGVNVLDAYKNFATSFFHGLAPAEAKELNSLIGASVDGAHAALASRAWTGDNAPGLLTNIANKFFTLTGLPYTLDGQKMGAAALLSHKLGGQVGREFAALEPATRRELTRFGITPEDWEALRTAPNHHELNGRTYLTPDAAMRSPANLTARERDLLGLKLQAYFVAKADESTITPGIGDRATLLRGTRPGTLEGEALRFIAQFKLWPTAAVRQGLGREINGRATTAGAIAGTLHLAFAGMVLGYTRMVLSDLSKGIAPRDPKDPQTWVAAMAQGGGTGILGDFLFGQQNRFGQGLPETILGPVIGESLNATKTIYDNIRTGDTKNLGSEAMRLGLNNTPFINLFYARAALNYLFLHSLTETMNPGHLQRMQRSLRQRTGQSYLPPSTPLVGWMNPQSHLRTFGR